MLSRPFDPQRVAAAKAELDRLANLYPVWTKEAIEDGLRHWAEQYERVLASGTREVNLRYLAEELRRKMNWPPSGPVPAALETQELAAMLRRMEAYNGNVPVMEAIKMIAKLEPDGPEARFFAIRSGNFALPKRP